MDNTNTVLAENIQKYRKKCGLTQEDLAKKLGVTFQAVSKWENSKAAPDITLIPTIAKIFNITTDDLFGNYEEDVETTVCEFNFGLCLDDFAREILEYGDIKECCVVKNEQRDHKNKWEVRIHFVSKNTDIPYILQRYIKKGCLADGYCVYYRNGKIIDNECPNKFYICQEKIWAYKNTDSKFVKEMIKQQLDMGLIDEE
ncbi:MAG: helix-turn-helix transcriptional regulator [Clostridia bacterium]|nr:helix-turn-helix transcriptional regulator [Clostridia bacterium]MBQ4561527.1 helix-turn-helix transcriptional regulator [Clostridia bacterium]